MKILIVLGRFLATLYALRRIKKEAGGWTAFSMAWVFFVMELLVIQSPECEASRKRREESDELSEELEETAKEFADMAAEEIKEALCQSREDRHG